MSATIVRPFWYEEFLFWGLPQITTHPSYEAAVKASKNNKRPWKKSIRITGPHYYEVSV